MLGAQVFIERLVGQRADVLARDDPQMAQVDAVVALELVEQVFRHVDLGLLDIKHMDSATHRELTGVDNTQILDNIRFVYHQLHVPIAIRVPTIPTVNASEEEFHRIAEYAKSLGVDTVHVLPYHTLGQSKYEMLGKAYAMGYEIKSLPREEAEVYRKIIESHGLHCLIGG